MKTTRVHTVSITEIRQDATHLIEEAQRTGQPILVVQRSRPAAYLVDAETYEAMDRDLRELRRQAFWQEVADARDEYRQGETRVYQNAENLVRDLHLTQETGERESARRLARLGGSEPQLQRVPRRRSQSA